MIRDSTKPLYEFGPFRLDPAEHTLSRQGHSVLLAPKVFEILNLLVANSGHLFEKDELMKAVWPDSFVEEGNLTRNISTLRTALGESEDQKYIETVPKRGYRFVAPVRELNGFVEQRKASTAAVADFGRTNVSQAQDARITDAPNLDQVDDAKTGRAFFSYRGRAVVVLVMVAFVALGYELFLRRTKQKAEALYWEARLHTGTQNRVENDKAIELLDEAVAADPGYAEAYALLAGEYHTRGVALRPEEKDKWNAKALEAINKALVLNPGLAKAHVARATMLWSGTKNYSHQQTVEELRRALALDPNLAAAHQELAIVYNHIGLLDKAEAEINKAVALDPANSGAQFRVGVNLLYQCRYDEALASFRESRKFNPPLWSYQVAHALLEQGKRDEAAATIAEARRNAEQDEGGLLTAIEAMLAAAAGDTVTAEEKIERAAELGKGYIHFHHTEYAIASAYALMNNRAAAMHWLQRAADEGFPCYPFFERDHNLDNLRQDPQFIAFMTNLKARWEGYRATL